MNTTVGFGSAGYVRGRFQPVLALAAGFTLLTAIGFAAGNDLRSGQAQLVRPEATPAAEAASFRSTELLGLVPDEYEGGLRATRNLRERLQAQRADFSAPLR